MNIKYSKDSLKFLAKFQKPIANNIREAIKKLTFMPPEGDIKILQGYDDGRMRLRVGKYRIIYLSPRTQQIVKMYEMLPEQEQELAYETIKRFVLAWDPDFTKVTSDERKRIDDAEKSGYISDEDIDWDNLDKYAE